MKPYLNNPCLAVLFCASDSAASDIVEIHELRSLWR